MRVKKYVQTFRIFVLTACLVVGGLSYVHAAAKIDIKIDLNLPLNALNLIKLAAVDLSKVLPYIMSAGDVFQGYEVVNYKGQQAFKLRIFNQQTGRIRYIYVDMETGRTL